MAFGASPCTVGSDGELAVLRYFAEWEAFNAFLGGAERSDEEADSFAVSTIDVTGEEVAFLLALRKMRGPR